MAKNSISIRKLLRIASPIFILALLLTSLTASHAKADVGPKPSMDFEFEYESGQTLEIIEGTLYECALPDCSDARPLEEMGPQHFSCTVDACSSTAYGYSDYHRLVIRFSDDKERQSNVFESDSFSSTFRVLVRENDLVVEKIRGGSNPFGWTLMGILLGGILFLLLCLVLLILLVITILRAGEDKANFKDSRWILISLWVVMGLLLIASTFFSFTIPITVAFETLLGLLYAVIRNRPKLLTITMIFLANMITLLPIWMIVNFAVGNLQALGMTLMEIIIWLVESAILYLTQRKSLSFREATILSLILNGTSFLIGLLVPL